MKNHARGFTLLELMVTAAGGLIFATIVVVGISLAVWGTSSPDLNPAKKTAATFADNFGDVENVSCMDDTNYRGNLPCTLFRKDGVVTQIECTEKGCFVVTLALD